MNKVQNLYCDKMDLYSAMSNKENWFDCTLKPYDATIYFVRDGVCLNTNVPERFGVLPEPSALVFEGELCVFSLDFIAHTFIIDKSSCVEPYLTYLSCTHAIRAHRRADDRKYLGFYVPLEWQFYLRNKPVNMGCGIGQAVHGYGDILVCEADNWNVDNAKIYTGHHFKHCFDYSEETAGVLPADSPVNAVTLHGTNRHLFGKNFLEMIICDRA